MDEQFYMDQGFEKMVDEDYDGAAKNYRKALKLLKKRKNCNSLLFEKTLFEIAWCLYMDSQYRNALHYLFFIIKKNPESYIALTYISEILVNQGEYQKAMIYIGRTIELKPEDNLIWMTKGEALHGLKRFREAIKCYKKANKHDPDNLWGYDVEHLINLSKKELQKIRGKSPKDKDIVIQDII